MCVNAPAVSALPVTSALHERRIARRETHVGPKHGLVCFHHSLTLKRLKDPHQSSQHTWAEIRDALDTSGPPADPLTDFNFYFCMCSILRYDSPSCLDVFRAHELFLNIVLRVERERDRSSQSVNEALYSLISEWTKKEDSLLPAEGVKRKARRASWICVSGTFVFDKRLWKKPENNNYKWKDFGEEEGVRAQLSGHHLSSFE